MSRPEFPGGHQIGPDGTLIPIPPVTHEGDSNVSFTVRNTSGQIDSANPASTELDLGAATPNIFITSKIEPNPTRVYEYAREVHERMEASPSFQILEQNGKTFNGDTTNTAPTIDPAPYVEAAFGGYGPGSPEYDESRPRLTIAIPSARETVKWFREEEIPSDRAQLTHNFSVNIHPAEHPGITSLNVVFAKRTDGTMLIAGEIKKSYSALSLKPTHEAENRGTLSTYELASRKLREHMAARIEQRYEGKTAVAENEIVVVLEDGNKLIFNLTDGGPSVGVNGKLHHAAPTRFGSSSQDQRQLAKELLILKEHFPKFAEDYADFFRKQLPLTTIDVRYESQTTESKAKETSDTQRIERLRGELVVEPDEHDFRYIGGLDPTINELKEIVLGFEHPEVFRSWGVMPPRGVLLHGPAGTGKTALAMAFAHESGAVLLDVKASKIKDMWHGETERNIRAVFDLADQLVEEGNRVVIFMDEIESLAPARDSMSTSAIDRNVVTEILQALNKDRPDCIVLAATNIPSMVDPALLRSGRFSSKVEVGMPDETARIDILSKLMLKFNDKSDGNQLFEQDIDIEMLSKQSQGLSGADLEEAMRSVLFRKATETAKDGTRSQAVKMSDLYQRIKTILAVKGSTEVNHLQ